MKKTLQDQYLLIKEGKGHKDVFIKEAKRQFPGLIRNSATYTEVANVLKTKNLINENIIGLEPINQLQSSKKESFEVAFENFLAEAKKEHFDDEKAELKKTSKQVEEDAEKNFDYEDKKNPDNLIFDQIMKGYYTEMKDPKNESKTMEQLKAIVIKNLEKNPTYYTEKGQFGVKDLGYTMDAPGLGEPKEPKGKYKSSGYGNLNEGIESHSFKVGDKVRFDGSIATIVNIGGGYAQLDWNDEFIEVSVKRLKPIQESINEETQIRKVVRSIINEELEEGYGDIFEDKDDDGFDEIWEKFKKDLRKRMGQPESPKNESKTKFVSHYAPGDKFEGKEIKSIKLIDKKKEMYTITFVDGETQNVQAGRGMKFSEKKIFESLNESKIRTVIRENVHKELAEINKLAEYEIFESKLEKIAELIEKKSARLNRLDEDEDLKALTDKKKVKELQKDIKKLEKAKAKIEKALAKKIKGARSKLGRVELQEETLEKISELCLTLKTDGLRGELSLSKAAKACAALNGSRRVKDEHVKSVAVMSLRHRLRRDPLDDSSSDIRVKKAISELFD